ncbi:MAG: dienelactone hydrolase family protein, partial [Methanoculleus sp.]|nr:dienelactone hydrolase family protein [Methanoculleus sp.]
MLGTVAIEINADKTSVEVHPKNVKRIPQIGEVYDLVEIETDRGTTVCHYYAAKEARNGVVMVGGAGGEFDTPARGLYPRLSQDLRNDRISTVRVHCRSPTSLVESVVDTVLGMNFLKSQGISAIGLVGYSFGGAVAIQAAAGDPAVRAVVAVAATGPVAGPAGEAA